METKIRLILSHFIPSTIRAEAGAKTCPKCGTKMVKDEKSTNGMKCPECDANKEPKIEGEFQLVSCASMFLDGKPPESIVYMPKGEWKITPSVNGEAKEINVKVIADAVPVLQAALTKRLGSNVKPFAQFGHRPGPASFHPKGFRWDENKGVMLDVEWTNAGKTAVEGRDYSYFSPTILLNKEGEIKGLPDRGEIGSLTNNPAFTEIQPII